MKNYAVKKLIDLPFYTEGPSVDQDGNFFFSALTAGFAGKIDKEGKYTKWATGSCPNGQVILPDHAHWFCDSQQAGISRYDALGNFMGYVIQYQCAGFAVSSPNDLILDKHQNLYFTDSVRHEGKVFFKGHDGKEFLVAGNIDYANGLALSPDENYLYVAESYQNRILVIELSEPGIAKNKPGVFARLPSHLPGKKTDNLPDGLAVDADGKLWVAHYGMGAIQILSSGGDLLFTIDTGLPLTSNLCFVEETSSCQILLVTGGYDEPGPGAVLLITVDQ
ncbi:SMP-30/gluconolactonase/LRE family protein [Dyadobacter frigoris]|uniref:SMP-30/gluconolactonase/LRE family protein n=1 Tax=Dyadobacter frigoris TaxID=2576211 RepID=A0A4U6CYS6_9BACT|nr:SMP-30/gluconolactonase/LRE family protein [Dyadobacter frigoris]TKT86574.1 SMP-30/gluconolactonase/LRE family protein [Dyadobacter frigoris]